MTTHENGPPQPSDGLWRVKTTNSVYVLNFDTCHVLRISQVHSLRWDNKAVPFLSVAPITLGHPMHMTLQGREDGVVTIRSTSAVESVVQILTAEATA